MSMALEWRVQQLEDALRDITRDELAPQFVRMKAKQVLYNQQPTPPLDGQRYE